jgi:hypothetical protein
MLAPRLGQLPARRGHDKNRGALTLVIGAIFAKNHKRALAACVTNCE